MFYAHSQHAVYLKVVVFAYTSVCNSAAMNCVYLLYRRRKCRR